MNRITLLFIGAILCGTIAQQQRVVNVRGALSISADLLISTVKNCKVKETETLLKTVDPNIQDGTGKTPLLISVLRPTPNCENITEMLINAGADVNVGIKNKHYPLHNVALHGHTLKIADLLIKRGANVNILDENKYSPLAYAIHLAHNTDDTSMAELLVKNNANVNEISKGEPLLSVAAKFGLDELVAFLIEHGANVNAVDVNSNTPLHTVVATRKIKDADRQYAIAELLISKGANVNAKNANDNTPNDLASNNKIKELLTKKGATN